MIILDTNVVSELMRPDSNDRVVEWLDRQPRETLFVTTSSLAELLYGVALLPDGARKMRIGLALHREVDARFERRLLSFDGEAAKAYAEIMASARKVGVGVGAADGQIAAIARARGYDVATRDKTPFETAGLRVVDPWDDSRRRG
jgi:predicted nucleic acid-binding protein